MKKLRLPVTLVAWFLPAAGLLAGENPGPEPVEKFQLFLEQALQKQPIVKEDIEAFHKRTSAFWSQHLQDYLGHPDRYDSLLALYHRNQVLYRRAPLAEDAERFRPDIEAFRRWDAKNSVPSNPVLFVGSSSIVLWETAAAFPSYPIINRGFGGSTLGDVNHFYDDAVKKYSPAVVVLYCDNDIYFGKDPAVALRLFQQFADRVAKDLPDTRIVFLSMKPTPVDDLAGQDVRRNESIANGLIKDFIKTRDNMRFVDVATPMFREGKLRSDIFLPDGLHMNALGYEIWNPIVAKQLAELYPPALKAARQ